MQRGGLTDNLLPPNATDSDAPAEEFKINITPPADGQLDKAVDIVTAMVAKAPDLSKLTDPASPETLALADRVCRELEHQVTPWNGKRAWAAGAISFIAGLASGLSSPHFATHFLGGPLLKDVLTPDSELGLEVTTAVLSGLPAVFLSVSSNSGFHPLWLNGDVSPTDGIRNVVPLSLTAISVFASVKINLDAMKDLELFMAAYVYLATQILTSFWRAVSSLGTNGLFAVKMLKDLKGNKDVPEMTVLRDAGKKLENLVKDSNYDEYIDVMMNSGLFDNLMQINSSKTGNSINNINAIFASLHNILSDETFEIKQVGTAPRSYKNEVITGLAYFFGLLASLNYFISGKSVIPESWGETAQWGLGAPIGVAATVVNMAIAATGLINFVNGFACKKPSSSECCVLPFKLALQFGYALVQGGMSWQYPLPIFSDPENEQKLAMAQAIISFLVSFTIAGLSFDGFMNKATIGYYVHYHKVLADLKTALNEGGTLKTHYESLNDRERKRLVAVLEDYRKWAFKTLMDLINQTKKEMIAQIFTDAVYEKLATYHNSKNHKAAPPASMTTPATTTLVTTKPEELKAAAPIPIPMPSERKRRAIEDEHYIEQGSITVPVALGSAPKQSSVLHPSSPLLNGSLKLRTTSQRRRTDEEAGSTPLLPVTSLKTRTNS